MKWWTAALGLLLGIALLASGQGISTTAVVKVASAPTQATLPLGGESTLTLRLFILPGWHINSSHPSDVLIPTELLFFPAEGIEVKSVWPDPQESKVSFSPKPLALYRGK